MSYAGRYVDTLHARLLPRSRVRTAAWDRAPVTRSRRRWPIRIARRSCCYGDGAIGFSLGDLDSLVRHGANVVGIVGNNGIWGLEKHPMQALFGYDVVGDLAPATRYDLVAQDLGCHGELVTEPAEIGPALDRAFAFDGPALVNVLTDPADAYPRSSNLG